MITAHMQKRGTNELLALLPASHFFLQPIITSQNPHLTIFGLNAQAITVEDFTSKGNTYCYKQVLSGKEPTPARCCSRLINQSL